MYHNAVIKFKISEKTKLNRKEKKRIPIEPVELKMKRKTSAKIFEPKDDQKSLLIDSRP